MTATRIITIKRDSSAISDERRASYDGQIIVQDAGGTVLLHSALINGFIVSGSNALRTGSGRAGIHVVPGEQPNYIVMPEIVITVNGVSTGQRAWYNLELLMSAGGYPSQPGSATGYYSAAAGNYGPNGYPTGGSAANSAAVSPSTVFADEPMAVDFEGRPIKQINLESYLKCFGSIPDKGAECTIELFTDIPVDGQPLVGFNPGTNSPGHTFLQISKNNSGQSIVQNIGFYPEHSYKTLLTTAPVTDVFGDDQHHEFNASMKMELTPTQFNAVIAQMSQLSKRIRYDLDEYNCADFALQVFNFVRGSNALEIPRMDIPGTINPYGSNTPQGVYLKLAELKQANGRSIGGFYLFYLMIAVSNGLSHGILALIAMSLFLIAHLPLKKNAVARSILDSAAVLCLLLSLYFFFHNDSEGYNSGFFSTGAFWITFSLFALAAMALLARNIWSLRHPDD